MTTIIKPMLAPNDEFDITNCRLPKLASYKIDGFRMFNQDGECYTRSGKPMANEATQTFFSIPELAGLDGELVVGEPDHPNVFNNSQGPLRRKDGDPQAVWHIFDDRTDMSLPFVTRFFNAMQRIVDLKERMPQLVGRIEVIQHTLYSSPDGIIAFEQEAHEKGYEGIMLRCPQGSYKAGRATYKENTLLKVKRLSHEEALIVGFEEQMINENEAFKDELGRTKRSQNAENLVGSGMVGAFLMKSPQWEEEFKVSASSLTHNEKREAFEKFDSMYLGQMGAFKYFGHGTLNAPRQGVFKGLRSALDSGE